MDDLIQQECLVESQIETYKSQVHTKTGYCVIYGDSSCTCDMHDPPCLDSYTYNLITCKLLYSVSCHWLKGSSNLEVV